MRIAIGADDAGVPLKDVLLEHLASKGIEVDDFSVRSQEDGDYPDVAHAVAEKVGNGVYERAVLICGTGLGVAIVANKVPGVRAATCHDVYSAERARKSNNAQVLTMGARVIGTEAAKVVLNAWLASEFQGGRSAPKVAKIDDYEARYASALRREPAPDTSC